MSDPKLPARTNFCKCPACGEYFNSEYSFNKHRIGPYTARRCRNHEEMRKRGMGINKRGYWTSKIHRQSLAHWRRTPDKEKDGSQHG